MAVRKDAGTGAGWRGHAWIPAGRTGKRMAGGGEEGARSILHEAGAWEGWEPVGRGWGVGWGGSDRRRVPLTEEGAAWRERHRIGKLTEDMSNWKGGIK